MRFSRASIALLSVLAVSSLTVAACSGPSEPTAATPVADGAAPAGSAAAAPAIAPFLTSDCAAPATPVPSDAPPADAQGSDGVFVTLGPQGVPAVTISDMAPDATTLQSIDLSQGKGDPVAPGDTISVNYCGVGLDSRQVFDSSWARGEPITFGLDGLIQGWSDGLTGMRVGGERVLVIPGALAYGANPPTPAIGPNETLVFVIQLLAIE